jgi:PAS domain S-box-containing protein
VGFAAGGALREAQIAREGWRPVPPADAWTSTLGWVAFFTVAFFLVIQLGLALLARPAGVSAFCPVTGTIVGFLIVLNGRARLALVVGLVVGAVATSVISDRGLMALMLRSICSAGEAVFIAWLLERWFGREFTFSDLPRVAGFLAAAAMAAAASATGGTATSILLDPAAPFWDVLRVWFLSNGIGIVVVAPLVIELARAWREPPSRREMAEGAMMLALVALVALYVHTHPTSSWISFSPDAFPLLPLLWLAVRCAPSFAMAGSFVVSISAICTTIMGIGHLSDAGLPIIDRVHGVQSSVMVTTAYTLVLIALFSERRLRAVLLERSNEELRNQEGAFRRLLGALPAAIHTTDTAGRITYYNKAAADLWGVSPELNKDKCSDLGRLYHADGTLVPPNECPTNVCLVAGRAIEGREALFERSDGKRVPIIPYPAPLTNEKGAVVGIVSMKLDISERKKAELALVERNIQLALAGKTALVGSYAYDADTEMMQISEGYVAIHGFPEGTTEIRRSECLSTVHPGDIGRVEQSRCEAFQASRREYNAEYRIIRPDREMRWVETRCFITYHGEGCPHRVVGVSIDITERKRVEEQQRTLVAELDHRVKNVLATVQAVAARTMQSSSSMEHFVSALDGRIRSMGSTHEILSHRRWLGIPLAELVERELAPYATGSNAEIGGPGVMLNAVAGQTMATVLHELVTNAAKYGALSVPSGRVSIRWRLPVNGSVSDRLVLTWRETGGPLVVPPSKSSYGMDVVRGVIPYELGGTVDHVLAPEGVRCQMELPLAKLSGGSSQHCGLYTQG